MTDLATLGLDGAEPPPFPMPRTCPFDPPPQYSRMRVETPITKVTLPTGRTAWVLTRHADVRRLLVSPHVSSDQTNPGFPHQLDIPWEQRQHMVIPLLGADPPVHTLQRRLLITEFTVNRIRSLRAGIQRIADTQIDFLLSREQPADLVSDYALPVSSLVICELLGVPEADRSFFETRTDVIVSRASTPGEVATANAEISVYLDDLVAKKAADPQDDMISRLLVKNQALGEAAVQHELLVGMLGILLVAGHDNTAAMIALGTVALLENPDQFAALKADPSRIPAAVDELLRYFSISDQVTSRTAMADIEIAGVLIKKGDGVIALNAASNRDPEAFENPDALNIGRKARHHLAFGYGIHQCIGQHLARLELEVAYNTLFQRLPNLRLAVPLEELEFKYDVANYGIYSLPVIW